VRLSDVATVERGTRNSRSAARFNNQPAVLLTIIKGADANVIDFERLRLGLPEIVYDLPARGRRLIQRATGYTATVKSGEVIFREGEPTGALPGKLLRGPQAA